MNWFENIINNVGRGAEDLFTLGGTELARKFGGQGAKNVLNPLATGLGSNYAAGAAGGLAMLGGEGLGLVGGGTGAGAGSAGAMSSYVPASATNMGAAGSTLGGGMGSALNLGPAYGSATGAAAGTPVGASSGASSISNALQMMRGNGGQQQPQQQNIMEKLAQIYKMNPQLSPFRNGWQ